MLATNIKNKNIRDLYGIINEFKKGYQLSRFQDNTLNISKNYFSQLMNVHSISDVRQIEVLKAELFIPDPITFEDEIATAISISNSGRTDSSRK
jgi:hypothetical protein